MRPILAVCVLATVAVGLGTPALAARPSLFRTVKNRVFKKLVSTNMRRHLITFHRINQAKRLEVKNPAKALRLLAGVLNNKVAKVSVGAALQAKEISHTAVAHAFDRWLVKAQSKPNTQGKASLKKELKSMAHVISRLNYRGKQIVSADIAGLPALAENVLAAQ
ncbi:MAG: hypothetical protein JRH20_06625 [Deltaproteobacteria bacterium]|nr:hypothetical protein [Deltaproteobacteria bacterium]